VKWFRRKQKRDMDKTSLDLLERIVKDMACIHKQLDEIQHYIDEEKAAREEATAKLYAILRNVVAPVLVGVALVVAGWALGQFGIV
jgi:F0F1-type ATP synthase assembly protein I